MTLVAATGNKVPLRVLPSAVIPELLPRSMLRPASRTRSPGPAISMPLLEPPRPMSRPAWSRLSSASAIVCPLAGSTRTGCCWMLTMVSIFRSRAATMRTGRADSIDCCTATLAVVETMRTGSRRLASRAPGWPGRPWPSVSETSPNATTPTPAVAGRAASICRPLIATSPPLRTVKPPSVAGATTTLAPIVTAPAGAAKSVLAGRIWRRLMGNAAGLVSKTLPLLACSSARSSILPAVDATKSEAASARPAMTEAAS